MLIQKTFHLQMTREVAKEKLSNLPDYQRFLMGVQVFRDNPEDLTHLQFRLPCGFRVWVDLAEIPGKSPAQTLFRSHHGNIAVSGVAEYFQIKPNLTEVVLTLDYRIGSPIIRLIDFLFEDLDRFLNKQLELVEAHFNQPVAGIRADTILPQPINGHRLREESI